MGVAHSFTHRSLRPQRVGAASRWRGRHAVQRQWKVGAAAAPGHSASWPAAHAAACALALHAILVWGRSSPQDFVYFQF